MKSMKKSKKYFLEFSMLFFAIFLGFLADNYRDSIVERSKEKEYIHSLIEDVEVDKKIIDNVIKNNSYRVLQLDSLSSICFNYNSDNNDDKKLYTMYSAVLIRPDFFTPVEFTMLQLKNSGGMRTIQKKNAIRAILRYDLRKKLASNQQKYYERYQNSSIKLSLKIFNYKYFQDVEVSKSKGITKNINTDYQLINKNKALIKQFGNEVYLYRGIVDYYKTLLENTRKEADTLILSLKQAYDIE